MYLESEFKTGLVFTLHNFQMGLKISNHCASINTILVSIVFGETIFHSKWVMEAEYFSHFPMLMGVQHSSMIKGCNLQE